jgi:DnaJ-domain-containing protein 1
MGIFSRLEHIVSSYVNDILDGNDQPSRSFFHNDADLDEAYKELEDYLNGSPRPQTKAGHPAPDLPPDVAAAFVCLGLPPTAPAAACKKAYRTLSKRYHPDHSSHEDAADNAERFVRIQHAYERLEKWYLQH